MVKSKAYRCSPKQHKTTSSAMKGIMKVKKGMKHFTGKVMNKVMKK